MNTRHAALIICTGLAASASAQPFTFVDDDADTDAVGPQNIPGKPTRAEAAKEAAGKARAQAEPQTEAAAPTDWGHWDRVTGEWGGARTNLERAGLSLDASFTADWFSVLEGGVRRESNFVTLADLNLTLDLAAAADWNGATLFADVHWIDGDSPSGAASDFQGVSNIDADNRFQLSELWFEQIFFNGALRLKAGKIEANSEFGFVDSAGLSVSTAFMREPAGFTDDETVFELYYQLQITPAIAIKPDIRYVINPGGRSAVDDVLVAGARLQVGF